MAEENKIEDGMFYDGCEIELVRGKRLGQHIVNLVGDLDGGDLVIYIVGADSETICYKYSTDVRI